MTKWFQPVLVLPSTLSLVSVVKLDAKVPLLGQGGEAAATDRGGGGSNGCCRTTTAAGFQKVTPPRAIFRVSRRKLARAVGYEVRCLPDTEVRRRHTVYRSLSVSRSFPDGQFLCLPTKLRRSPLAYTEQRCLLLFGRDRIVRPGFWTASKEKVVRIGGVQSERLARAKPSWQGQK